MRELAARLLVCHHQAADRVALAVTDQGQRMRKVEPDQGLIVYQFVILESLVDGGIVDP
jgi:hypothetical protein